MDTAAAAGRHADCASSWWSFAERAPFDPPGPRQQPGAAPPLCRFFRPPGPRAAAKRPREVGADDEDGDDLPGCAAAGSPTRRKRARPARPARDRVITAAGPPSFVPGTIEEEEEEEEEPPSEPRRSGRETAAAAGEDDDLDLEVDGVIDVRGTALDTVGADSDGVDADPCNGGWWRGSPPRTRLDGDVSGRGPAAGPCALSGALVPRRRLYNIRFGQSARAPELTPLPPHLRFSDEFDFRSLADCRQAAAAGPHERRGPASEKQLVLYRPAPSLLQPAAPRKAPPLLPEEIDTVADAVDAMDLS